MTNLADTTELQIQLAPHLFSASTIDLEALISFLIGITTNEAIRNPHIRCHAM
jgi:hypothetical protein